MRERLIAALKDIRQHMELEPKSITSAFIIAICNKALEEHGSEEIKDLDDSFTPAINDHSEECDCDPCVRDMQHHQIFLLLENLNKTAEIIAKKIG